MNQLQAIRNALLTALRIIDENSRIRKADGGTLTYIDPLTGLPRQGMSTPKNPFALKPAESAGPNFAPPSQIANNYPGGGFEPDDFGPGQTQPGGGAGPAAANQPDFNKSLPGTESPNYGRIGGFVGSLAGPAGYVAGRTAGTALDVNAVNKAIRGYGFGEELTPEQIASGVANSMSFGLAKTPMGEAATQNINAGVKAFEQDPANAGFMARTTADDLAGPGGPQSDMATGSTSAGSTGFGGQEQDVDAAANEAASSETESASESESESESEGSGDGGGDGGDAERRGGRVYHKASGGSTMPIHDQDQAIRAALLTARGMAAVGGLQTAPQEPSSSYFEVAPGKTYNPQLQSSWETLHPQAKEAISNKIIGEHLSDWQRTSGIQGEVRKGVGGFGGYSNPNYNFHPYDEKDLPRALSEIGHIFSQDAMMGAHHKPFKGSSPAGVVRIQLPKNISHDEAHEVYKTLNSQGLADGHSTDPGQGFMDILSGNSGEEAHQKAFSMDKALSGKYVLHAYPTNIAMPEYGVDYARNISSRSKRPNASAPAADYLPAFQSRIASRLKDLVEEAHRQGGGHEGEVGFGDTLSPGKPSRVGVSALLPTTVSGYKGLPAPDTAREDISPSSHSAENRQNIALRMYEQHPAMWTPGEEGETPSPEEAERRLTDFHVKNLLALWDRTPVNQRKTSRGWYRAAHALGNQYADAHGLPPEAAHGMMAVLSPQTPWDKNVTLAERVMDALTHHQDTGWTAGMSDVVRNGGSKGNGLPEIKTTANVPGVNWSDIEGKTLKEVLSEPDGEKKASMWIRAFDEAHNPREYQSLSPTGEFLGPMMNKSGSKVDTASWNSYLPIEKAISIYRNPTLENLNENLGNNHKVREFYNVIANPHDPNGVVIDTHAVAAGQMLPHGSSAKAVHQNFGTTPTAEAKEKLAKKGQAWLTGIDPSKKTGSTGATGDYPIHAEAVRQAAMMRGVHPSEMQSVTWETVRTLFRNKSQLMQEAARNVWKRYAVGELSHPEAIDEIIKLNGGFSRPAWQSQAGQSLGKPTIGSYQRPTGIASETPALPREQAKKQGGTVLDRALRLTSPERLAATRVR